MCDDSSAHPVTVTVRHLPPKDDSQDQGDGLYRSNLFPDDVENSVAPDNLRVGTTEIIKARYVVGCDGARSWTRE